MAAKYPDLSQNSHEGTSVDLTITKCFKVTRFKRKSLEGVRIRMNASASYCLDN